MGAREYSAFGADDVLPAAARQKTMVVARDQLGAVLEPDAKGWLDARPLIEHNCLDQTPVAAPAFCSVDPSPHLQIAEWGLGPIRHKDAGIAVHAVAASMRAAPIRID